MSITDESFSNTTRVRGNHTGAFELCGQLGWLSHLKCQRKGGLHREDFPIHPHPIFPAVLLETMISQHVLPTTIKVFIIFLHKFW